MSEQVATALPVPRASFGRIPGIWVLLGLLAVMAALPAFAAPYTLTLMLPFLSFGIALLGFNLLFGATGLLSFGHAMFMAVGAYAAAAMTSKLGVLHFEFILLASVAASAALGLAVGALCVRYTAIFFGMLTLAFGMGGVRLRPAGT